MHKERVYVHEIIAFVLGASTPPSSNSWSERCCPRPCLLGTLTQPLLQLKSVKTRCKKCFKLIDTDLRYTNILAVLIYYIILSLSHHIYASHLGDFFIKMQLPVKKMQLK